MPSGRLEGIKIVDMVLELASSLPRKKELKYVIAMDNYFTLPNALHGLRQLGVACVGTARARRGWPPKELTEIDDDRFNTIHTMRDEKSFRIFRWVDNNVVTMVSTLHDGKEKIERERKKPRINQKNKAHVESIFGKEHKQKIFIPGFIDDYNHWMLGVDKSDQLIAYYRPKLRVRRYWMAMFFHCLDVVRINSFIVFKNVTQQPKYKHKTFLRDFVDALIGRGDAEKFGNTRKAKARARTPSPNKRHRVSKTRPSLPIQRFRGNKEDHVVIMAPANTQRACVYCSYLAAKDRCNGSSPRKVRKPARMCMACQVHLCTEHFDAYHSVSTPQNA